MATKDYSTNPNVIIKKYDDLTTFLKSNSLKETIDPDQGGSWTKVQFLFNYANFQLTEVPAEVGTIIFDLVTVSIYVAYGETNNNQTVFYQYSGGATDEVSDAIKQYVEQYFKDNADVISEEVLKNISSEMSSIVDTVNDLNASSQDSQYKGLANIVDDTNNIVTLLNKHLYDKTTSSITTGNVSYTAKDGDVVVDSDTFIPYVWTGGKWDNLQAIVEDGNAPVVKVKYQVHSTLNNCTLSPTDSQYDEGSSVTFTVTANNSYHFTSAPTINGVAMTKTSDTIYTSTIEVHSTINIVASAEKTKYTITYQLSNATIDPSDQTSVDEGTQVILIAKANDGYKLDTVTVNGQSATLTDVSGRSQFTFTVTSNTTVVVSASATTDTVLAKQSKYIGLADIDSDDSNAVTLQPSGSGYIAQQGDLASDSSDGAVEVWNGDTWQAVPATMTSDSSDSDNATTNTVSTAKINMLSTNAVKLSPSLESVTSTPIILPENVGRYLGVATMTSDTDSTVTLIPSNTTYRAASGDMIAESSEYILRIWTGRRWQSIPLEAVDQDTDTSISTNNNTTSMSIVLPEDRGRYIGLISINNESSSEVTLEPTDSSYTATVGDLAINQSDYILKIWNGSIWKIVPTTIS